MLIRSDIAEQEGPSRTCLCMAVWLCGYEAVCGGNLCSPGWVSGWLFEWGTYVGIGCIYVRVWDKRKRVIQNSNLENEIRNTGCTGYAGYCGFEAHTRRQVKCGGTTRHFGHLHLALAF